MRVVTEKLESLFHGLAQAGDPIDSGEQLFALQRAVRAVLSPLNWPINAHPATAEKWKSFQQLADFLLEKDATEPQRGQPLKAEEDFRQQGRRRQREARPVPMDVDRPSSSKAAAAQGGKKRRYAYAGGNQLSRRGKS